MKTKILTIALISLMMGITLSSNAGITDTIKETNSINKTQFQACINLYPDNIVKFLIEKVDQDKVKLRIYNENGFLLYNYVIKKHNTARIGFDISILEAGNYDCVVEKNKEEILRKRIVKEN
jgi:hypothetical protein